MTPARPACSDERDASPRFTCAKDHCPNCGAHSVSTGPDEPVYRCELEALDDEGEEPERPEATLEAFA